MNTSGMDEKNEQVQVTPKKDHRFQKLLIIVNAVLLLLAGAVLIYVRSMSQKYRPNVPDVWTTPEKEYSQISVYFPSTRAFDIQSVYTYRGQIQNALKTAALVDKDAKSMQWADCAYGETVKPIASEDRTVDEVLVTVTTGDFFVFHPLELVSGCFYSDNDINLDCVVIDDLASWRLFGGMDTAGMTIKIEERIYTISGVVRSPQSHSDQIAYGSVPHIYVPYMSLKSGMTVYEMCIPEAVEGNAKKMAEENIQDAVIIDQTDRFDIIKLVQGYKNLDDSIMIRTGFAYPWFENSLRAAELKARMFAFPMALLMLIPAFSSVYLLFFIFKLLGRLFLFIRDRIEDRRQIRLKKNYERTHPKTT